MHFTDHSDRARFFENLDRWRNIVHHVLRRGYPPRGITEDNYILLHRELLRFVQQPDEGAPGSLDQTLLALHHALRPWVNLETLSHSDKRILQMLEQDVDHLVRGQLGRSRGGPRSVAAQVLAASLVLVVVGITIKYVGLSDAPATAAADGIDHVWQYLQGSKARIVHGIAQSSLNQRLSVLAGSIVVLGMFFLRSPKRF